MKFWYSQFDVTKLGNAFGADPFRDGLPCSLVASRRMLTHLFLHTAPVALGAALQLQFHFFFQITDEDLSHTITARRHDSRTRHEII
jgi:hypothetical protein